MRKEITGDSDALLLYRPGQMITIILFNLSCGECGSLATPAG